MKRHALFVGVDRYADGHIPNLSCAVNDATDLHGFFKFGAGYDRVELLPNPAGRKEVLGMVRELTFDLGEGDFFLFFFAGHGFRVGENHVLVCEEDLYEDLKYEDDGLPLGQLKRRLSGAFDSALLLDACQSDILATRGGEGITERDISLIHEVSPVRVGGGSLTIVTSCDAGQTAAELSEGRHGLFTMAILDLLKEAQGAHTRLDLSDAFRMNLGRRMGEIATRYGLFTEQRPRFSCSGDSCFILLDGSGAASAAKVVAPLPSTVTGVSEGDVGSCVENELDVVKKSNKLRGSIQFDMGYLSPEFVTGREDMECVLENPFILLFEENISNLWDLLPLLQSVAKTGRPIVIIAGNVEGEALSTLVINKLRGTFQACAVKAPNDCGKEFFEDIAIFTNGKFISKDFGIRLESVSLELLGRAKKVIVAQDSTIIIGGSGNPEEVKAHVDYIRREIENATFSEERHRFKERLSRLSCEEYGTAQRLYIQAVKHYRGKNFAKAFDFYQRAAKKGEMEAAYSLGGMYENGEGVEKNNERAKFWYCRAAELGSERAERSIKKCEEAWIKDLKAKALQGDIDAQYYLGKRFYDGDGVERDYEEAFKWYSKAAENGHAGAQCSVAEMYECALGVDEDHEEAARWYQMAFENGHPEVKDSLCEEYYTIAKYFCGDYEESIKWYFKAAELGHSDSQFYLGVMYENGRGVTKDDSEAVKWYRKAAEQGDVDAQFNLGLMYEDGRGVTKDDSEAVKWYRKAAEQGLAGAQFNLGLMYYNGRGVAKDESEAVKWFRKAAEQGFAQAQHNLGVRYENGISVDQNHVEALTWYLKAAVQERDDARDDLQQLLFKMLGSEDEADEAKKWCCHVMNEGNEDEIEIVKKIKAEIGEEQDQESEEKDEYGVPGDSDSAMEHVPRDEEKCKSWYFIREAAVGIKGSKAFPHVLLGDDCLIDYAISTETSALLLEVLPFSCDYAVVDENTSPAANEVSLAFVAKLLKAKEFLNKQIDAHINLGVFASQATLQDIRSMIAVSRFKDVHLEYLTCANFTTHVTRLLSSRQTSIQDEQQNSAQGLYEQAENYYHGQNGVMEDRAKAFELYKKASELGHAESQYSLGYMYAYGECTTKDEEKALFWYRKAAKQGHEKARRMVEGIESRRRPSWGFGSYSAPSPQSMSAKDAYERGENYYYGRNGFGQDYAEAVKWYRKAAEQGYASGQCDLGFMYANGRGVAKDDSEAVKWYRKAVEQGNAQAQCNLGFMYENGRGVTKDDYEAVKWYRKAAEQGNASAQFNLGFMYEDGRGVRQDDSEAVKWYCKSAEQGNAGAQCYLGWMYENGRGVTQDFFEAVKWYRKAADQGNASAQCNLGVMYDYGKGIKQDFFEALKWYRKAADSGFARAQFCIGLMYERGRGFQPNYEEAAVWYRKAISNGYEQAKEHLKIVEK